MRVDLSVIIPAYNEQHRIERTLDQIARFLGSTGIPHEIVVVDDGSADDTVAVVQAAARRLPALRVIETCPNRGKGHAVRVGMTEAAGAIRIMCDADGSMPADELPKLYGPIARGEVDIAIGSRYVAGGGDPAVRQPWWRRGWSRLANQVIQRSLVAGIRDTQCGFKAFSARAADEVFTRATIDGWAFDLEALALARRMGFDIAEVGVVWRDDRRSRVNPLRDLVKVVREWMTIRSNLRRGVYGALGA